MTRFVLDKHKRIEFLSNKYRILYGQSRGTHSPCVLDYLNYLLNTDLPRPIHEAETYPYRLPPEEIMRQLAQIDDWNYIFTARREEVTIRRIIRDTRISNAVKELHDWECQLCGYTIHIPNGGKYAEAHHIRPLGSNHNGLDHIDNILCVCPNCHAKLDYGVIRLDRTQLSTVNKHCVNQQYIDYHNTQIFKGM